MSFYEETRKLYTRFGYSAERPTNPPDKSALFWELDTGNIYCVNDEMDWVLINQPFPPEKGVNSFTGNFTFATTPSGVLMTSGTNTLILQVIVEVVTPFTAGTTARIGDAMDTDRLFPAENMNLEEVGRYEFRPLYAYSTPTDIEVRVDGGATDGFCIVWIVFDIDSQN